MYFIALYIFNIWIHQKQWMHISQHSTYWFTLTGLLFVTSTLGLCRYDDVDLIRVSLFTFVIIVLEVSLMRHSILCSIERKILNLHFLGAFPRREIERLKSCGDKIVVMIITEFTQSGKNLVHSTFIYKYLFWLTQGVTGGSRQDAFMDKLIDLVCIKDAADDPDNKAMRNPGVIR